MQNDPSYKDVVDEVRNYLAACIDELVNNGVTRQCLAVDPGIGFGKTAEHNLIILKNLAELTSLHCPILVGTSRKSFIGKVLGDPVQDRLEGTLATNIIALWNGANILRVHDVRAVKKAAIMADAIKYTTYEKGGFTHD